jgi:hypothetical protein
MRTPQWNGDDGLTASTVAPGKFQRRLVPVELNKEAGMQSEARHMGSNGYSQPEIASHLKIGLRTVERWQAQGLLEPDPATKPPGE